MNFEAGKTINDGKYRILKELSRTPLEVTYLAKTQDEGIFVIKTLNNQTIRGEDFEQVQDALAQETMKLLMLQDHPHVVRAEIGFKEGNVFCLPTEYVPGDSLDMYVHGQRNHKLSEAESLKHILQIGEALDAAHKKRLLHLALKPENIRVRIQNRKIDVVLTSFGLERRAINPLVRTLSARSMTEFDAPELSVSSKTVNERTDIYALGAIAYFLITGEKPPKATKRIKNREEGTSSSLGFPKKVSLPVQTAITRAMELKQEDRPASVQQWLNDLKMASPSFLKKPSLSLREMSLAEKIAVATVLLSALGVLANYLALPVVQQQMQKIIMPNSSPSPSIKP